MTRTEQIKKEAEKIQNTFNAMIAQLEAVTGEISKSNKSVIASYLVQGDKEANGKLQEVIKHLIQS